ncbi:RNA polymerase sigma factor [Streptomyces tricolor]
MSTQDSADGTDRPATAPAGPPGQRDRARQQTDEEFSAFYRAHVRPLVAFLVHHGAGVHTAADIAQEVMLDAYRNWSGINHPKAWVHTAASRALARKIASVEEPVEEVPEPTSLLARPDAIVDWETRHDILPLLRSLPPRQRQVMAWTLAGFTPTDIAGQLDLSAENVRANLMKARRAVAAHLNAGEEER